MSDLTGKRLFFQLLHTARMLKTTKLSEVEQKVYLAGVWWTFKRFKEDFTIADDMRDVWKHQRSGAE